MGKISTKVGVGIIFLCAILAGFLIFSCYSNLVSLYKIFPFKIPFISKKVKSVEKFTSEDDFKSFLSEAELTYEYGAMGGARMVVSEAQPFLRERISGIGKEVELERVSETTVQVPGIDEPDIVKTDGKEIYFSPGRVWPIWREPIFRPREPIFRPMEEKIWMPPPKSKTKIIKAFPPEDLSLESEIENTGDLLLIKDKNVLVIFSYNRIFGYDISNPKAPTKKWEAKIDSQSQIVTSRLYKGKIYLVTKRTINRYHPCPIKPLEVEGKEIKVRCGDIYHPVKPFPVDTTFIAMILDPLSGKIEKKIAFVGSLANSVVYMSENSLYITYTFPESFVKIFSKFIEEKGNDLFPDWLKEKIKKLESYDISQQAKMVEFQIIFEKYENSLDEDEKLRIQNELENRFSDFVEKHKREFEKTGIVKINLGNFEISATGEVPGFLLNQFSLDEYQRNLRIAVTIGERWFWGLGIQRESANDVYVLNENLEIIGKVQDLGLRERIYSVRFIQDKGYLVTFRQTDPFYVLDLSDPKNPQLKGELKIPGYSSYLHPISKDKILGIGKEGWKVKISLFDVSDPENPKEVSKYILDESWSDILNTHHAFLLDKKHQIFFLPGSKGGYVFSYEGDKLKLVKAVSQVSARRAIYINDYLYIISDSKITVLNENTWEKVKEFELL
jgi:uncharacterized secreted protein with C-terminal beta-propeller domain